MPEQDKDSTATATLEKADQEPVLSKEEQEQVAHEQAVNEDQDEEFQEALKEKLAADKDAGKDEAGKDESGETASEEADEDEFDSEILSIAADLGMSEARARRFASVKDLEQELRELADKSEAAAAVEPEKAKPQEPSAVKPEPDKPASDKPYIVAGEDLDEGLVKQLNAALGEIGNRYDGRAKQLEEGIAGLTAQLQANQAAQFVREFDNLIDKHGTAYSKELGSGATFGLSGKYRTNRESVVDEMTAIVARNQRTGKPALSDEHLLQKALVYVFGGKEKDNGAVEKRTAPFLRRGSSRGSSAPSRKVRARLELRERLDALGGDEDG